MKGLVRNSFPVLPSLPSFTHRPNCKKKGHKVVEVFGATNSSGPGVGFFTTKANSQSRTKKGSNISIRALYSKIGL